MARAGTLTVKLLGDSGPLERTLGSAGSKIGKFAAAAAAAGGAAAVAFGVKAVNAASELNETLSKTQVVFGRASDQVIGFADKMADAFGLPKQEMLDAASNIGLVAKASGLGEEAAAGMSVEMAQLAADASSFYNVPLPDALEKIRAGLVGEAEPLRAFGVLLSAAAVQEKAVAMGIAEVGEELTEQQKVMARAAIITDQMSDASGDLERTQDSLANRVRELQGRFQNFAAAVGERILPMVLDAWDRLEAWWSTNGPTITDWLRRVGDRALELGRQIRDWWQTDVKPVLDAFVAAVQENWPKVEQLFQTLGEVVADIGRIFKSELDNMSASAGESTDSMSADVGDLLDTLNAFASSVQTITSGVSQSWNFLAGAVTGDLGRMWTGIDGFTGGALTAMKAWGDGVRASVVSAWNGLVSGVGSAVNSVIGFINRLINAWNAIDLTLSLPKVPDWVPGIGGKGGGTISASTRKIGNISPVGGGGGGRPANVLHSGGVFRAPSGQGEGLALLRDREVVTTPEAMAQPAMTDAMVDRLADRFARAVVMQMRSA